MTNNERRTYREPNKNLTKNKEMMAIKVNNRVNTLSEETDIDDGKCVIEEKAIYAETVVSEDTRADDEVKERMVEEKIVKVDYHGQCELDESDTLVVDSLVNALGPVVTKLGFGGILGYCSGYAIRIGTRIAATTIGIGFVCLQTLQYFGYIEINWIKIRKDLIGFVDSNNSGTVDVQDLRHYCINGYKIMRYKGPPAAGFGIGVYMGLMSNW